MPRGRLYSGSDLAWSQARGKGVVGRSGKFDDKDDMDDVICPAWIRWNDDDVGRADDATTSSSRSNFELVRASE
jgi:hypothetical protein